MRSRETNLYRFLSGGKNIFVIPVFQRNYDWEIDQCDRLISDIRHICDTNKRHFIGTICFKEMDSGEVIIIDGQQRITSIMLLSKALHDVSNDPTIKRYIDEEILKTKYTTANKPRVKLKPIKKDESVYNKLIFEDNVNETTFTREERRSNIYKNYEFFVKRVKELKLAEYTDRQISDAIEKLEVVELQIEDENPQVVFESLNSTGLDLTKADLIRNFVLMPLSAAEQDEMYTNYWLPMENVFGNATDVESFMVHFLVYEKKSDNINVDVNKHAKITRKNIYDYFKKEYSAKTMANPVERLEFFKKIKKYSSRYRQFIFHEDVMPQNKLEEQFYVLFKLLNGWDAALILLYVYDLIDQGILPNNIIPDVLNVLISFTFRSNVCRKQGAIGMNKQTAILSVQKFEANFKPGDDFIDLLYKTLNSFKGGSAFPRNAEFRSGLLQANLYGSLRNTTKYLLHSIERYYNPKEVVSFQEGTIEHVLPQTLTKKQKELLNAMDEKTLLEHENIIHTLGNLTLTGYNSELSNDMFEQKKDIYKDSNYTITKNLSKYNQWTSKEISDRGVELANIALKIWSLPAQYETKRVDTGVTYSLDSDFSIFAGKKPNEFMLNDKTYMLNSWRDMIFTTFNIIWQYNHDAFYEIMESNPFAGRVTYENITETTKDIKPCLKLPPKDTEDVLRWVKSAIELCDRYYKTNLAEGFAFTIKCDSDDNSYNKHVSDVPTNVNIETGEVIEEEVVEVSSAETLFVGDRIVHNKFGKGTIVELKPSNNDVLLRIRFDSFGEKMLMRNIVLQMKLLRKIVE